MLPIHQEPAVANSDQSNQDDQDQSTRPVDDSTAFFQSEEPPPLPSMSEMGDFRILREISRGGMGVVYLAEQKSLGRMVALKVLPQRVTSQFQLALFQREAKASAKLRHPNIVQVYMVGEVSGTHYIAMEYVDGVDLAHELAERRQTAATSGTSASAVIGPVERTVRVIASLADALDHAH